MSSNIANIELNSSKPYPWMLNPWIDILFCCGGLLWILFSINYCNNFIKVVPGSETFLPMTAAIINHVFSNSHTAATLTRIYQNEESINRFFLYSKPLAIIFGILAIYSFYNTWIIPIMLKIYILWVIHHYTSQTYGIALIYCYKRGYILNGFEKRIFWLLMMFTAYTGILRQVTDKNQMYLGFSMYYDVPFWGPVPKEILMSAEVICRVLIVAFCIIIVRKFFIEKKFFPLPALLLTATGILIILLSGNESIILWFYVPALFHGSQYIVVTTSYYLKEKGLPNNLRTSQIASLLKESIGIHYLGLLIMSGFFIYTGLPTILSQLGIEYKAAFTTIFAVFNFHHFLTDREIWRLRDPNIRQILLA